MCRDARGWTGMIVSTLGLRHRVVFIVALFAAVFLLAGPGPAVSADPDDGAKLFEHWERQLDTAQERVDGGVLGPMSSRAFRSLVREVIEEVASDRAESLEQAGRIEKLLNSLGPEPEDDSEDPTVQSKRAELTKALAQYQGRVKRADLTVARAKQILDELSRQSRARFRENLLQTGVSPLVPASWTAAVPEFAGLLYQSYVEALADWLSQIVKDPERSSRAFSLILIVLVVAVAGYPLGRWLLERYGRRTDIAEPSYARRLLAAFVEAVARGLLPVLFVIGVIIFFTDDALFGFVLRVVVGGLAGYLGIFFVGYGLIRAVFTPDLSAWRLTPLHTGASKRVVNALQRALIIFVVFGAIAQSISWATISDALLSIYAFVYATALYGALWALLKHRVWLTGGGSASAAVDPQVPIQSPRVGSPIWARTRSITRLALMALPVSAVFGYPKLAAFLINASMLTGLAVGGFLALRWLGHEASKGLLASGEDKGRRLRAYLALTYDAGLRWRFWINLVFGLVLVLLAVSILLPIWGVGVTDTLAGLAQLFRGFQVGSYTFSLFDFLLAAALFAVIMVATRFLQRGLDRHFLPSLVRDTGVRNALRSAIGYIGVVIAALVGISVIGLDLSNLALIAGALSFGLGFGLQNIVSNFVSGLILLAERPIKPGDWVVVGGHEGTVKKVNVRSTEIETFQRASVMIPNADLIASPVTNWTHKNILGRLEIRIGVAYGSDVELVRDTLLELARAHPMALTDPEPMVIFMDFGASSLDFELRCFLRDIAWVIIVGSELRFAIDKAFREKAIEIPFPQHVVHMAEPAPAAPPPTVSQGGTKSPAPSNTPAAGDPPPLGVRGDDGE